MKKKPYVLPKLRAMQVSDPVGNWYRDEDERLLAKYMEEDNPSEVIKKPTKENTSADLQNRS
jgi:hypothetical protein